MDNQDLFLITALLLLASVILLMILPFLGYILGASLLAFILYPLQTRLRTIIGSISSAILLVFFSLMLIILPATILGIILVEQTADIVNTLEDTEIFDIDYIENTVEDLTGAEIDIQEALLEAAESFSDIISTSLSQFLGLLVDTVIGVFLLVFILFYLLKDGEKFISHARTILPLPESTLNNLQEGLQSTTWAVIKGHVFVSLFQAALIGLIFGIIGIPNFIFWTFLMIILGFIPLIGTVFLASCINLSHINRSAFSRSTSSTI